MSENFASLFEQYADKSILVSGTILKGIVEKIDDDYVVVNAGLKSEGIIPKHQFMNDNGELEIVEGAEVEVALEAIEDGWGETRLSREKAKRAQAWKELAECHESGKSVFGIISGKVKGGFTVDLRNIRAFLPGSLVDLRPVRESVNIEGKELEFKVIKLDQKRNNVVVSRRSVIESENSAERESLLSNLEEGQVVKGIVKNLTDYGAFVDLGGIDGLLHITDMAWRRVKHPSEIISVGQELNVKVLKFDRDKSRVSLGLKQLGDDPWMNVQQRYPIGVKVKGKVTNITDYGCFVELEQGVEGLVHVSEMDWTNKNIHPSKVVELEQEVEVIVLEIDEDRRRVSLGLKQCKSNPWEAFSTKYNKGDTVTGKIKSITDFGVFIGLEGGIDGLIHLSDLSWKEAGEEAVKHYKKNDEVTAMVLSVDPERERISLGIKQLSEDPFGDFLNQFSKGSIVKGTITSIDAKGATVNVGNNMEAYMRASEFAKEKTEDAATAYNVGDVVEAKIITIDKKNRNISLSVKARMVQEDQDTLKALNKSAENMSTPTLGELLKEHINKDK